MNDIERDIAKVFGDWLHRKFIEWQLRNPRTESPITDFARWLGVSQPTISQWMRGRYIPKGEQIQKIANKLGDEVFLVLGIEPEATPGLVLFGVLDALPEDNAAKLEGDFRKWLLNWMAKNAPDYLDKWEGRIKG